MASIVKLTLNSLAELSLMEIGAGNWAAKDAHLPLGKGSGGSSTWTGRAQVDFQDPAWPASGRIVKATLSGKTGATGAHADFRGGNPAVSLRRLTSKYTRTTNATNDGYYTQNSSVVYPGTASVDTDLTFAVADTAGKTWSKDITDLVGVWAPARIKKRNGKAGDGAKWYGIQLRSTDESAAAKSSILSPDMTITIEIDVASTPNPPTIYAVTGAETDTSDPMVVGSADGRTLEVEFAFSSPDPADTCAKAELTLRGVGATADALGPVLYTTGAIAPTAGSGALLYRLKLTALPRRTPFRIAIQATSQASRSSEWSDPEGTMAYVQTATIPGAPLDRVFQAFTDDPHALSSLNSPDPDDYITGWHGRFTRVPAGTSAWDSGEADQGGAVRRSDVTWGGGSLADGERISYIERHRNRDQAWGTWSVPLEQTMRERVGPTLTPDPGRLTTRRPTFTIAADSFDGYRLRLLDGERVLYDTAATSTSAVTSKDVVIPAGVLAFGQRFTAVSSTKAVGAGSYGEESTAQEYTVTALPTTAVSVVDAVGRRVATRDIGFKRTFADADGDTPQGAELELRVAATPQGSGALIERRYDTGTIPDTTSTGRRIKTLTTTTDWTVDANVAVATYSATNPTGYAAANSLEVQGTGGSSTDRGARFTFADPLDLSAFGTGALIRIHRRCTSVTNLVRWVLRFEFATSGDYAEFELVAAADSINTWAEITVAKGDPRATAGTVDWANVEAVRLFADVSGAYTGSLEVRDLRIGTVQTDKTVPDGSIAWEASVDVRSRARDDADALVTATTLSAQATAGTTTPSLTSTTGIEAGMSLVFAGVVPEVREVASIGPVTLSEALTHTHAAGQAVTAYPFGPWASWQTVTAMEPPTVVATSPADASAVTTPTPTLTHTYSSIRAQASRVTEIFRRRGLAQRTIALGAVSAWRLADASGAFVDEVGGIDGTEHGTMTRAAAGLLSPYDENGAVHLDGSTGYITFGDVYDFAGVVPFTVVALVNLDALPGSTCAIIGKEGTGSGWSVYVTSLGKVRVQRRDGSGTDTLETGLLVVGTTHTVVATYDGALIRLYVDGVFISSTASTRSMVGNANSLTIGRQANGAAGFLDGFVDEAAVFDVQLDDSEVEALEVGLTEYADDSPVLTITATGTDLDDDVPPFLLEESQFYAWRKTITDEEGLSSVTDTLSFSTTFTVPTAAASFTATADSGDSAVLLEWPALDPDTWVEVETQLEDGSWIRIDGGPEELLDEGVPYTGVSLLHVGARLGDNAYRLAISNGWRSSDAVTADADLTRGEGIGAWLEVSTTGEVLGYPVRSAPRIHPAIADLYEPPGGIPSEIRWGAGARRITIDVDIAPATYGNLSAHLRTLVRTGDARWIKAPAGWGWDPMWMTLQSFTDTPGIGGRMGLSMDWRELGDPTHAVEPDA